MPIISGMKRLFKPAFALLALLSFVGIAHAQTASGVNELDLDLRGRIAAAGASGTKLYTAALRTNTTIAPGVHLQLYGTHRYGLYGVQQASVEREWGGTAGTAAAGIVRLPFGIYDPRETYASGLIDYPLARGDYAYHSVDWGVPGVAWSGGPPNLQAEAAGFSGRGTEIWDNTGRIRGAAARVQTYAGTAIFGFSRWDGSVQNGPTSSLMQPVHLNGLDLRYTKTQLLVRGEYLFGALSGDRMTGWYLDAYYRLPQHEKWSLVGRLERLKPGSDDPEGRQVTLGVRYVAARDWTLAVNWRRNNGPAYGKYWTPSAFGGGDVLLQAYHRAGW